MAVRDEERPIPADPVAPAQRWAKALRKASTQEFDDGSPVHCFITLLKSLHTIVRNRVVPRCLPESAAFEIVTTPAASQARALALLRLSPKKRSQNTAAEREFNRTRSLPQTST